MFGFLKKKPKPMPEQPEKVEECQSSVERIMPEPEERCEIRVNRSVDRLLGTWHEGIQQESPLSSEYHEERRFIYRFDPLTKECEVLEELNLNKLVVETLNRILEK